MVFVLRPECIVSMLLCPDSDEMGDNEAVVISGAECFSSHRYLISLLAQTFTVGMALSFGMMGTFKNAENYLILPSLCPLISYVSML